MHILPNSLFDDGSIACKTFFVIKVNYNGEEVVYTYNDFDVFKKYYGYYLPFIEKAISENKHHLTLIDGQVEIQWD